MRKLTQLQYTVIFLYSKGLTFKDIDKTLTTASRGVYSQVVSKDKSRVTRAKNSRKTNLNNYKRDLKIFLDEGKQNNRYLSHFSSNSRYIVSLNLAEESFRKILKSAGFVTRDPREKERKKPGLKKARRAPQFSKR